MATQTTAVSESVIQRLPLRELGFEHVPAVPVDIRGMLDAVVKLGVKEKVYEQALQGLSKTYTIGGSTARAYTFLFGNEGAGAKRGAARERLHGILRSNPSEIHRGLAAEKLDERHEERAQDHDLTTLSLDDPKQWSMGWTTLPDAYSLGMAHLDEWAATVDVDQPDMTTEAFFPTIARYGRAYNLILPKKARPPRRPGCTPSRPPRCPSPSTASGWVTSTSCTSSPPRCR
jgi:hypothetical protein